jgi:surface polysaccharide O-acyltransferase-like enzyme
MSLANNPQIEQMRVVSTVAVVLLHVASDGMYATLNAASDTWWAALIYDAMVRFSVPLFVMISGALLLSRTESFHTFIQQRFNRIFRPFIFWWVVYFTLNCLHLIKEQGLSGISTEFIIDQIILGSSYHLWYIYMIFGVYLLMPLLAPQIQKGTTYQLLLWIVGWFFFIILLTFLPAMETNSWAILPLKLAGYLGYAVLGYFLFHRIKHIQANIQIRIGKILAFAAFIAITLLTHYESSKIGEFSSIYFNYLTPLVALQATGIFLWLNNIRIYWGELSRLSGTLAQESYGIYLSHVLIIWLLSKLHLTIFASLTWLTIPIITLITLIASWYIVKSIRKIDFLKKFGV